MVRVCNVLRLGVYILASEVETGAADRRPHILFLMVDVACLQDPLA